MTSLLRPALAAALIAGLAGSAFAQAIPPGQSCGGLFCDMGIFGQKVAPGPNGEAPTPAQMAAAEASDPHRLPCHDFLCRAFGQKDADAAPPPPPPVAAAPAVEPEPVTKHARKAKHKRVAKAEAAAKAPAAAAPAAAPAPAAAK